MNKAETRNLLKLRSKALSDLEIVEHSDIISDYIVSYIDEYSANSGKSDIYIASYMAKGSEVNLNKLHEYIWNKREKSMHLLFPRVINAQEMEFCHVNSHKNFQSGVFGILEPDKNCNVYKGFIDIVLIPGLGFDRNNNRIGHGAGYYDRYLGTHSYNKLIGVAHSCQIVDCIPTDIYDVQMNQIITENMIG